MRDIAKHVIINDPYEKSQKTDMGNYIMHLSETIIIDRVKQLDNFYIEELFKAYKDTEVSSVFVIDMTQFEYFLKKYLPIFIEEQKKWNS